MTPVAMPAPNAGALLRCADIARAPSEIVPGHGVVATEDGIRAYEIGLRQRLYRASDPSSQIACSIGGNGAKSPGGVHG